MASLYLLLRSLCVCVCVRTIDEIEMYEMSKLFSVSFSLFSIDVKCALEVVYFGTTLCMEAKINSEKFC